MIAILDAGPLYASIDRTDRDYVRSRAILDRRDLEFVVPALVLAEVVHFAGERLGPRLEASFIRGLTTIEVEAPQSSDWPLIADLVERYGDFPLGAVDASVAVLADRLGTDLIVTLDRRHFAAIRSGSGRPYQILPD